MRCFHRLTRPVVATAAKLIVESHAHGLRAPLPERPPQSRTMQTCRSMVIRRRSRFAESWHRRRQRAAYLAVRGNEGSLLDPDIRAKISELLSAVRLSNPAGGLSSYLWEDSWSSFRSHGRPQNKCEARPVCPRRSTPHRAARCAGRASESHPRSPPPQTRAARRKEPETASGLQDRSAPQSPAGSPHRASKPRRLRDLHLRFATMNGRQVPVVRMERSAYQTVGPAGRCVPLLAAYALRPKLQYAQCSAKRRSRMAPCV